jgi:hypothetical protein
MPAISFFSGGNPPAAGTGEVSVQWNTTSKLLKMVDSAGVEYSLANSVDPTNHALINTTASGKTVRLNSRTDTTMTSGDLIGFQSKPRIGITGTQSVYGFQVSAQISDAIALTGSGSIIGGHVDVYVRGTAAGTIAGDVRGLQIELTTDDAATRTISGNVSALRLRMVFSATTISGTVTAIRIEKPEVQTNSKNYSSVFELTSTLANVWSDTATATGDTEAGYFAVRINGNLRYVQTFSDAGE